MSPLHLFQFLLYSVCIQLFTVFTYVVYYSDLFSINYRVRLLPEYDYVIVGSGTAGSVIAHRLATETNYTFIVLEAGSRSHFLLDIPIVGPALHRSLFDWNYKTVPQEDACFAMVDKKCRLPQGKIIGGSSKLNNMIHFRGYIPHYVDWFQGKFTEEYIRKHFELVENNMLHLNNVQYESDLANAMLYASEELGFEQAFTRTTLSQRNGKRWSISDNIDIKHIVTNALVENIIIKNNQAIGVKFTLGGVKRNVLAKKGVILSAGAFNTPKILQLSGIGPSKLLKSLNIPVIKDLPVGENLKDHIGTGLDLILLDKFPSISAHDIVNPINSITYFLFGKGPLTTPGAEVIGFVSTKNESTPDLQLVLLPMGISSDKGSRLRKSLAISDDVWNNYFVKTFDKYTASLVPIILHPKSKGTVFIDSVDPKEPPVVDPKYLQCKEDRDLLIKGLKLVTEFLETESMKNVKASINTFPFPGCEKYTLFSDSYWGCYIKHLTLSIYHPVGTCSMGLPGKAVVDTSFRILGVKNLLVADASVLPTLPSANINAAVAMMASIFFDVNIKANLNKVAKSEKMVCHKYDLLYQYMSKECIIKTK